MRLSGSGITGYIQVKVQRDFAPITNLALTWSQVSDGNYIAVDRGAANDVYRSNIKVIGLETEINALLSAIEANRVSTTTPGKLTLSGFATDEKIFGEDVSNTSIDICVMQIGERSQSSLRVFDVDLKLRVWDTSALTFIGSQGNVTLQHVSVGYNGYAERTDSPKEIYSGAVIYQDNRYDTGLLEISAIVPLTELVKLRRSMAIGRSGGVIFNVIGGVSYPYGPTRPVTFPLTAKVIKFTDDGPFGQHYRKVVLTVVEVI
jgi:hypothetical protein